MGTVSSARYQSWQEGFLAVLMWINSVRACAAIPEGIAPLSPSHPIPVPHSFSGTDTYRRIWGKLKDKVL